MPDERGNVKAVSWQEVCPWLCLLRVFGLAKEVPKLLLATAAILATAGGWWGIGYAFSGSSDLRLQTSRETFYSRAPWTTPDESVASSWTAAFIGWGNRFSAGSRLGDEQIRWLAQDPFLGSWQRLSRPFWQLFESGLTFVGFTYVLLCALWTAAVWALFGGAITRIAAVELASDQRLSMRQALRHALVRWRSYFGAPFFPLLGVLIGVVFMAVAGLLLRPNSTLLVMAIVWPLLLAGGLVMAIVSLGLVFGWPLMWATISTEGTDAFDALSRSYSYTYQRPLHYLFYALVAALLGVLGWLLVAAFASAVAYLSLWGTSWGAGGVRIEQIVAELPPAVRTFDWLPSASVAAEPRDVVPLSRAGQYGARLIGVWLGLVKLVALGFAYSYFWTASTAIYLLLRRTADHTEMDEVYLEEQETSFGLPPLKVDSAGVPMVDDQQPPPTGNNGGPPAEVDMESRPAGSA
jgi:hypothetical protein